MAEINKATLTEADIISKYLLPAIKAAGWDDLTHGVFQDSCRAKLF